MNPEHATEIQIYYPDGTVRVGYQQMSFLRQGVYIYRHQTAGFDPKGPYSGNFHFIHGDKVLFTERQMLFEVI